MPTDRHLSPQFSYPDPAASDVTCVVEGASTPGGPYTAIATKVGTGSWTWSAGGTAHVVLGTPAGGRVTVTVGDSQPFSASPARFLRLRSTVNP